MKCNYCKRDKNETTDFYTTRKECKTCAKERIEEARLKREYNLTSAQVDQMIIAQDHKCSICNKTFDIELINSRLSPVIDHDHTTGAIRGVICRGCNVGIGHFGDNATLLRNAVEYLESRFLRVM